MTRPHDSLGRATVPGPRSASPRPPEPEYPVGKPFRVTAYAVLLVLGAVVGLAGTFVLSLWFPGGLVLSLAAIAALCCGGRVLTGSRTGSAMPALGWFAMLMVAQAPRPDLRGLTGNSKAIEQALKDYRVYAQKVPVKGGDYSMDHTAIVYLMDKNGHFVAPFSMQRAVDAEAVELRQYL